MSARIRPESIPEGVRKLCDQLARHGFRAWVVGGCLRDLLRGQPAADWDLATNARPEDVQRVFARVIPTGIQHGTVTVRLGGHGYEVTTLRGEGAYSDGRRPDTVEFVDDITADLARRDFSMNAIAYDPIEDSIADPFDGLADLSLRLIRAVGQAEARFSEDGLRVLRAARFVATLEFELEAATEAAIRPTLDTFRKVSAERVRDEWVKALKAPRPSRAFVVMARTGILEVTCPALAQLAPASLEAALEALDAVPSELCVRMAALLSPWSAELDAVTEWLTRLRWSNQERERIVRIVRHHQEPWAELASDAAVRRFAQRVGRAHLADTLAVSLAVARARFPEGANERAHAERCAERVAQLIDEHTPLTAKELALSGRELMGELGVKPGPLLGQLIEQLLDGVIERPALNERQALLDAARTLLEKEAP